MKKIVDSPLNRVSVLIAIILFFTTAKGQIFYSVVNPGSVIINSLNPSYNFDLDNDGVTDFVFQEPTSFVNCRSGSTHTSIATITAANVNIPIVADGANLALSLTDYSAVKQDSLCSANSQAVKMR